MGFPLPGLLKIYNQGKGRDIVIMLVHVIFKMTKYLIIKYDLIKPDLVGNFLER